jgi:hypothetical protein|tara:strand:+ start:122 stop:559 length:438 start_codon:yes stop_codon:yes gene_type:complete
LKPIKGLARGIKEGYRSGLEVTVSEQLTEEGIAWGYESYRIPYMPKRVQHYTPDFNLGGRECDLKEIIVETKGRFVAKDRTKHLLLKEQYPNMDLRFVFSNPNQKLYKGSRTTYGQWCDKHGFKYSKGTIPREWFIELGKSVYRT